ncbi:MAG: hypothetical protein JSW23_06390 [Planctomycetota bacterium]|nr:MAG: hypothetical protein JSW23_06390 [Planctomycetota bacterium]
MLLARILQAVRETRVRSAGGRVEFVDGGVVGGYDFGQRKRVEGAGK